MTEKWLCRLWRRQDWLRTPLVTANGQPLHVIYAGRHTFDHGPDFRDALLAFDDQLVRGDVEVHIRCGDWRRHGHQVDNHYDRVVLHVVWRDDGLPAKNSVGGAVPLLTLAGTVAEEPGMDDLCELPGEVVSWRGLASGTPCAASGWTASETMATLEAAGLERLREKAARYEAALTVADASQVLYAALLDVLGYAANREPFRQLGSIVPWRVVAAASCGLPDVARVTELEALFLGSAGLLPSQRRVARTPTGDDAAYAEVLEGRWTALNDLWRIAPIAREAWRFARVRPENFPPRRLAAAAWLFAPYVTCDLAEAFVGVLRSEQPAEVAAALEGALAVPALGYWATHSDFGSRPARPSQVLGRSRAAEGAVNVLVPFVLAWGEADGNPALADNARQSFRQYPALAENEISRYMARLIFAQGRPRGMGACHQQGLLHVYQRYCQGKHCGECPLASAAVWL